MRLLLVTLLLVASASVSFSGHAPLTTSEISLMLRSGFSNEAVLHELSERHFADVLDAAMEKQLVQAGANQLLIDALRSGAYEAAPSEIAAAKKELAAKEEHDALASGQSREPGMTEQSKLNPSRSKTPEQGGTPSAVFRLLNGDLVYWHQGGLTPFDDTALENKKIYIFFFSANWSREGRKFTPQLVEYYNRVASQHPEFEVIFFSADHSEFGMTAYMSQSNMPWPAVDYKKLAGKQAIQKDLVHGLPCLILVNAGGKILFNSHGGETDLGPEKALAELDKILASGNSSALVRAP